MNDKTICRICLIVTIIGMIIFVLTYKPDFEEQTIDYLTKHEGSKGIIFGRVETVIKRYPTTLFILTDGNTAMIFYPNTLQIERNDFVTVYAENEKETYNQLDSQSQALFAHKVVKE